ncbi:MAG: copper homeostasis protein CutC [Isosphaera sp.]|nr:copper homeostasis protein CutC [Isosphaera sp.]
MRYLLEVACESVADAEAAEAGGADRVELCAALDLGGLTPSAGLYREAWAAVRLPVWVMIRPRPGDFVYSPAEVAVMAADVDRFRPEEPAGFVFGVLSADGRVDRDACRRLLDACAGLPAVFHRAFDRTPSASEALDAVAELGFRRVLTSGGADTAAEGAEAIARIRERAAGRVEVLPCGRVRAGVLEHVLQVTGCDQVHGSFAEPVPVSAGAGHRGYPGRTRVGREAVAAARAELDRLAAGP